MELRWCYHGYRPLLAKQLFFRVSIWKSAFSLTDALILSVCCTCKVIFLLTLRPEWSFDPFLPVWSWLLHTWADFSTKLFELSNLDEFALNSMQGCKQTSMCVCVFLDRGSKRAGRIFKAGTFVHHSTTNGCHLQTQRAGTSRDRNSLYDIQIVHLGTNTKIWKIWKAEERRQIGDLTRSVRK